jgi:hypothetical protein
MPPATYNDFFNYYADGLYDEGISAIKKQQAETGQTSPDLDTLLLKLYQSGNYLDKGVSHALKLLQMFIHHDLKTDIMQMYQQLFKQDIVIEAGIQVLREMNQLEETAPDFSNIYQNQLNSIISEVQQKQKKLIIYPLIWPIAFGDTLVIHQFIKQKKEADPDSKILLIMPLNRRELKELAELNTAIDYTIDITLLAQEKHRHQSLLLKNGNILNITCQEYIINQIIQDLQKTDISLTIEKTRYFPVLYGIKAFGGWRIWEKRAQLFLHHNMELPKLVPLKPKKKKTITIHIRQSQYDQETRNIDSSRSQELIDSLAKGYPDYRIIRLGDPSMSPLNNCQDLSKANLPLSEQIKKIQESRLFIGTQSAPQHLAVAVSNTPVICINYSLAPTCSSPFENSVSKMSYEPVGKQVKAVLYMRMFDQNENELIPHHDNTPARCIYPSMENVMAEVKKVLA